MSIKFISEESLVQAFIKGIDNFNALYKLQSNKNIVSSHLGNIFQASQKVHTNNITSIEVEKANNLKATICRLHSDQEHNNEELDKELKNIFKWFGKKLQSLGEDKEDKNNRRFITSHYSYICLSIFYNASIILVDNNGTSYTNYLSSQDLLKSYLTPDTRQRHIIKNLFTVVGKSLQKETQEPQKYLKNTVDFDISTVALSNDTDKLWAFLCGENQFKDKIKNFLGNKKFEHYSKLHKALNSNNHALKHGIKDIQIEEEQADEIKKLYELIKKFIDMLKSITNALFAYQNKFNEKTGNISTGSEALGIAKSQALIFSFGSYETHISGKIQNAMGGLNPTKSLKTLQTICPPGVITKMTSELLGGILQIATASKGYGVIHRHGITGQTRAMLFKDYVGMIPNLLMNSYDHIFSLEEKNTIMRQCRIIEDIIYDFIFGYEEAIKILPNKKQNGSLYYYLNMYVHELKDEDGNYKYGYNVEKIQEWNRAKLKGFKNP